MSGKCCGFREPATAEADPTASFPTRSAEAQKSIARARNSIDRAGKVSCSSSSQGPSLVQTTRLTVPLPDPFAVGGHRRRETVARGTKHGVVVRRGRCRQTEVLVPTRSFQDQQAEVHSTRLVAANPPMQVDRRFRTCRKGAFPSAERYRLFRPTAKAIRQV